MKIDDVDGATALNFGPGGLDVRRSEMTQEQFDSLIRAIGESLEVQWNVVMDALLTNGLTRARREDVTVEEATDRYLASLTNVQILRRARTLELTVSQISSIVDRLYYELEVRDKGERHCPCEKCQSARQAPS